MVSMGRKLTRSLGTINNHGSNWYAIGKNNVMGKDMQKFAFIDETNPVYKQTNKHKIPTDPHQWLQWSISWSYSWNVYFFGKILPGA